MKIYIKQKILGKKDVLKPMVYEVSENISDVRTFLEELTAIEVERYNRKETGIRNVLFLSEDEIEDYASTGKVNFGRIYSEKKADLQKALENSIQCFQDGMIRIFHGEKEVTELEEKIEILEGDTFTLIRLTFLAGRMW